MPTTFLSYLLLPLDSLPAPLAVVSRLIPATWLIDASRGMILRGAEGRPGAGTPPSCPDSPS